MAKHRSRIPSPMDELLDETPPARERLKKTATFPAPKATAEKISGSVAFDSYHQQALGARWPALRASLAGEPVYQTLQFAPGLVPYHLDEASVWAAQALAVEPGMRVLDLCAAPGGKSLVLASCLAGQGHLLCNELSPDRKSRLIKNLDSCLPKEWRAVVQVCGQDGSRMGLFNKEMFDRVLLDAPCSSERHVLASPRHLSEWSPARTKNLAVRQLALACAAFDCLAPGGVMVYSTCSLSRFENSGVVEKLLEKRTNAELLSANANEGMADGCGWQIWPDQAESRGPIWFAKVRKQDGK